MSDSLERRTVFYSGQVQGVGFRYTTQLTARAYPVAGYVRNLPNGEVELVVEGTKESLNSFLSAVAARMAGSIADARIEPGPATGEFETFGIRF